MTSGTEVRIIFFKLGNTLQHVHAAPVLTDDTVGLSSFLRNLLRQNEEGFECTVRLEGFPAIPMRFRALCQTAAIVVFPSYHPVTANQVDALCLLVNGLEVPQDKAAVKASVNFPPHVWAALEVAEKPVVIAAFYVNGRLRDPATRTILDVLANVYFKMFGTNDIADEP